MMEDQIRNSYTLVTLPLEVVETVAQFLSVRDLSACCASSRSMRDVFSQDSIWRPRCDKKLFDYLRTTPCKVEPNFVSPENEDSTLSPIPQWKLAYMRQNHLWNNWRQGKYKQEVIHTGDSPRSNANFHFFLSNDCIIARYADRIELLDVRKYPATKVAEDIRFSPTRCLRDLYMSAEDGLFITVFHNLVVLYQVNITSRNRCVKQAFFLDESQPIAAINGLNDLNVLYTKAEQNGFEVKYLVVNKLFIGIFEGESKMHIWDIERGFKIKEEKCPVKQAAIEHFKASDTMNIILHVKEKNSNFGIFHAYNLNTFKFLPFNIVLQGYFDFCIIDKYVAIWSGEYLNVYNYETSQSLLINQPMSSQSYCQCLGNKFLFINKGSLNMFQPSNQILKPLLFFTDRFITISESDWFTVLSNKFIQLSRMNEPRTVYEVDECFSLKRTSLKLWFRSFAFFFNETATRYIVRDGYGNVLNFW